jgi:hypothetical protein
MLRWTDSLRLGLIVLAGFDGSIGRSLVAALDSADRESTEVLASLGAILALWVLLYLCYRAYARRGVQLPEGGRDFWLANILFPTLLLLPIVDERLMSRMVLFAKTGAEHIANWYFGVEAGVITSLDLADFDKYNGIYVLNPIEGELDFSGLEGIRATHETDRYLFMRRNIPRPAGVEPLFASENLELFRLDEPPKEWLFTADGRFHGYSAVPET